MILGFEMYPIGENCQKGRSVVTLDKCKAASAVLGLYYKYELNNPSRPAGCYWKGKNAYLNTVVDPYQTIPESLGARGGVCVKGNFWHCNRKKNTCMIIPYTTLILLPLIHYLQSQNGC